MPKSVILYQSSFAFTAYQRGLRNSDAKLGGLDCRFPGHIAIGPIRMVHYLLHAKPKLERLAQLHRQLHENAFVDLRPFGKALTHSLAEARAEPDGTAVWEEDDYCSPPLAQERAAVLDKYFDEIKVEQVNAGEGWNRIQGLPNRSANR